MKNLSVEELLFELIACPSLSGEESPYACILANLLRDEGLKVEVDDYNNVFAFDDAEPKLIFSTHIDTVPPFIPPRLEGRVMFGRGACDTKGGFVAQFEAFRRLKKAGFKGLGFALVVKEETDHSGAKVAIESPLMKDLSAQIILCEPTKNRLVGAQKGLLKIRVDYQGKAAHSAYPDRGFSAIHDMLPELATVLAIDWPSDERLGPTTINIGEISGGVAANVFAPASSATLMIRLTRPVEEVLPLVEAAMPKANFEIISAMDPVFYNAPEHFETCNVSFNTDAAILSKVAPVWLCGPGDIEVAHSDNEHIDLDELIEGIDLYESLGKFVLTGQA